ncbi:MAG: hypothetical protein DRH32_07160 [Deltaproteobacteria bacterium]|nr:MAG: hypothetical protein DRH32_07160 [Deltaproteobacteria bacterium]
MCQGNDNFTQQSPPIDGTMKPLKIAVVIPKYGLLGGAEGFASELTKRLAVRDEFDMHVFANRWKSGDEPIAFHHVPIIRFPRWLEPISFAWFVARLLEKWNFDVVHSHERIFAMDIFSFHGIPHLAWRRNVRRKAPGLFDLATAWVEKKGVTCHRLKKIMPVSSLVARELERLYNVPKGKIRLAYPGVSLERFDRYDRERCRMEIRAMHGFSGDDLVLLFVGMNFEIKRLDLVVRSIAELKQNGKTGKVPGLLVVGKGDAKKYSRLAENCGIGGLVKFAGEQQDVVPYYLACDALAMPSVYDTFGMVVLEAMAACLPVIISENVGAKDIVEPGIHGYVLPNDARPGNMAKVLTKLADTGKRTRMAAECRKRAERFSWERLADDLASLYLDIGLDKSGPTP